jgi:hypothetical protein
MKTYFVKGIIVPLVDNEIEQIRADIVEAETFNDAIIAFRNLYVGELQVLNLVTIKQVVVSETI